MTPVNFVLVPDGAVRAHRPGTRLVELAALSRGVVAFEADDYDAAGQYGWSVVVHGSRDPGDGPPALVRLAELPLAPWASAAATRSSASRWSW